MRVLQTLARCKQEDLSALHSWWQMGADTISKASLSWAWEQLGQEGPPEGDLGNSELPASPEA